MERPIERRPVQPRPLHLLLLVAIAAWLIPQGLCYTLVEHSVCKSWTDQGDPIAADKFLLTDNKVYLYVKFRWTDVQEFERLWGLRVWIGMRGLSSADAIEGAILDMKVFKITLKDPSGVEVNLPSPRKMHRVICDPPGCISSGFWEILTITDTTKNGRWKVSWYEGDSLKFADEFVVGEETPEQSFLERYILLIGLGSVIIIAAIAVVAFVLTRKKRTVERPPPSPPPPA